MGEALARSPYRQPTQSSKAATKPFPCHWTGSTTPTTKAHEMAPASNTPAVTANAQKKCPVRCTTKPVSAGDTIPAKLPTKFCSPVHLPAARGPAIVCVIAQRCEGKTPAPAQVTKRKSAASRQSEVNATTARHEHELIASPVAVKVFRTRVGLPPPAIHRSETHPEISADTARMPYAAPPMVPIFCIENDAPSRGKQAR